MIAAPALRHLARVHGGRADVGDSAAVLDSVPVGAFERAVLAYLAADRMPSPDELTRLATRIDRSDR